MKLAKSFFILFFISLWLPADYLDISYMLKDGLEKHEAEISAMAKNIPAQQLMAIYDGSVKNAWIGFGLNALVGFGVGSFVQGDTAGGVNTIIIGGLGWGAILGGTYLMNRGASYNEGRVIAIAGLGVLVVNIIYQWARPFEFAKKYNERLYRALRGKPVSFNLDFGPHGVGNFTENQGVVAMVWRIP